MGSMIGTPAQWAAAGDTAAADALVERIPNPVVAVWTLLSLLAVADSEERAVTLLRRAGAAAASVVAAEPRAVTTIAVVRAAVAAGQADAAGRIASAAEPGLREHLAELLAAELARHGDSDRALEIVDGLVDPRRRDRAFAAVTAERARRAGNRDVAVALAERVTDPAARVSVLLAAGLVDQALAVPLSSGEVGVARTELAVALAGRGDAERAVEIIQQIPGRRRRHLARRAAFASALPVPAAVGLAVAFPDGERNRRLADLADLAARAGRLDDAVTIADLTERRIEALRGIAVATAERGAVSAALALVADLEPHTGTALRLAEAVARHGDQDTAIAMITDPATCAPYSWESPAYVYHVALGACAAAANGDLARALAAADTARQWDRATVVRRAAFAAARHGHPRTALALVAALDSGHARQQLTATMLGVTAAQGDLPSALALLDANVPRSDRLRALVLIGRALVRAGRVPATGLLVRAEALNAERVAHGDAAATLELAELAAVEGAIDRAVAGTTRIRRPVSHPNLRRALNSPVDAILRHIACAAAAQGRIDEALTLVEPCHSLAVAAAVGGQLPAALAMATDVATDLAARPLSHSVAVHRRDIVTNICRTLAAAGEVDRALEAANVLPPRHRDAALRVAARTAVHHGHLEAALRTWWLVGGPGQSGVAEMAVTDIDTALATADTLDDDAYHSRDRALMAIAAIAACRGLVPVAAAAVAGIEFTNWSLGPAWRHIAARFDEDQLRAAASAYLTARTRPAREAPPTIRAANRDIL
jgi:hypothetical protein